MFPAMLSISTYNIQIRNQTIFTYFMLHIALKHSTANKNNQYVQIIKQFAEDRENFTYSLLEKMTTFSGTPCGQALKQNSTER
jgi:hypothetical protein